MNCIIDILSKKLPSDVNINAQKLEQIVNKIKLIPIPKNLNTEDVVKKIDKLNETGQSVISEEVKSARTSNERAIVRIRIPRKDNVETDQDGELDDKSLAVAARYDNVPYSIFVFNEAVPKAHRREIVNYIKKNYADHFDGKDSQREGDAIFEIADDIAQNLENKFIETHCDDERFPCFDFDLNLNDNE